MTEQTEQRTQPHHLQMTHSHYATYGGAELPAGSGTDDDLNGHIASYLDAGWVMAFYSVVLAGGGSVHHFIWRGPEPATT
jgi:hypothetical protein